MHVLHCFLPQLTELPLFDVPHSISVSVGSALPRAAQRVKRAVPRTAGGPYDISVQVFFAAVYKLYSFLEANRQHGRVPEESPHPHRLLVSSYSMFSSCFIWYQSVPSDMILGSEVFGQLTFEVVGQLTFEGVGQ